MRFLSHSEFTRALIHAGRRSGLPLAYTGQRRARMKISLSPPIPIGITSECELIDFELGSYLSAAEAQKRLNHAFPDGIRVVEARLLTGTEKPVGRIINAASYEVSMPALPEAVDDWTGAVQLLLASETIEYERAQHKRTRVLDIRPGIHSLTVRPAEGEADGNKTKIVIIMTLDDGIAGTIKPWEVIEVLANHAGIPRHQWKAAQVHRTGLHVRKGDRLLSPMEIGKRRSGLSRKEVSSF